MSFYLKTTPPPLRGTPPRRGINVKVNFRTPYNLKIPLLWRGAAEGGGVVAFDGC
jgi:hypothetical protein